MAHFTWMLHLPARWSANSSCLCDHRIAGETLDFTAPQVWPLNSPDLNLDDYAIWGILQKKVYQTCLAHLDELKQRLNMKWAKLDHAAVIAAAICQWRHRLSVLHCKLLPNCHHSGFDLNKAYGGWWRQMEPQDVQSSSQIITTNKPTPIFYRPDALPVAQPTVSEH